MKPLNSAGAMQFALGSQVSLISKLWRVVCAKANLLSINRDLCHPTAFVGRNAEEPASIVALSLADVLLVVPIRYVAQVINTVVNRVAVYVVNLHGGPVPIHVEPRSPMSLHLAAINLHDAPAALIPSSNVASLLSATLYAPRKYPSLGVVMHKLTKAFCAKIRFSHAVVPLKQWFGQRPTRVCCTGGLRHFNTGGV